MIVRSAPGGISGAHHWMNSIVVSAIADEAQSAMTAAADAQIVRDFLKFIFFLPCES
jgi:hypothetical protein